MNVWYVFFKITWFVLCVASVALIVFKETMLPFAVLFQLYLAYRIKKEQYD